MYRDWPAWAGPFRLPRTENETGLARLENIILRPL